MKILITGGHLSPALAFIEEYKKINSLKNIIFVGRKYINNFEKILTLEYKEITKNKIKFIDLPTGRLTRVFYLRGVIDLFYIPLGFYKAWHILEREKPDVILSFGGYIALPIAFWSFFKKIPIFTHEQTLRPGLTNRIIGYLARKIFLAFPETKEFFPREKTLVIGNLVRQKILKVIKRPFIIKKNRPVIYITGGSLGSHSINLHIKNILPSLLKKYIIIHQTGDSLQYKDYEKLKKIKSKNYFLKKHFFQEELGYVYKISDLIISRAGANTFFELLYLKKPAILIPLPWSANQEQLFQAKKFKNLGLGEIFYQSQKSYYLLKLIDNMILNIESYKKKFNNLNQDYINLIKNKNATNFIIEEIKNIQSSKSDFKI